jgi:hypothetical protein
MLPVIDKQKVLVIMHYAVLCARKKEHEKCVNDDNSPLLAVLSKVKASTPRISLSCYATYIKINIAVQL